MSTVWNNISNEPASFVTVETGGQSNIVRLVEDPDVKKNIKFDEAAYCWLTDLSKSINIFYRTY